MNEASQEKETVRKLSDVAEIRYLHRGNTEIFLKNGFTKRFIYGIIKKNIKYYTISVKIV